MWFLHSACNAPCSKSIKSIRRACEANILLRSHAGGDSISLEALEQSYGEIDWDECVRTGTLESKRYAKSFKRTCRTGTDTDSQTSAGRIVVAPGTVGRVPAQSEIDKLFASIIANIDAGKLDTAKDELFQLQNCLKVTSGRESRRRGGWHYAADFVLDTVLFADLLRNLQSGCDVMSKAVKLTLGSVTVVSHFGDFAFKTTLPNPMCLPPDTSQPLSSAKCCLALRAMNLVLDSKLGSHLEEQESWR